MSEFSLESYMYALPEERIAQFPAETRAASRLMVLDRKTDALLTARFADILNYLPEGCLLVANNSRVVPARISGWRKGGGKLEFLLLSPVPLLEANQHEPDPLFPTWSRAEARGLIRPAKKVQPGDIVSFGEDLALAVLEKGEFGQARVELLWHGDLLSIFEEQGAPPLPLYIKRRDGQHTGGKGLPGAEEDGDVLSRMRRMDKERYQTVYSRREKSGSVAAPTAGLHFSNELCRALLDSGREWTELTLHVGYGTFSPVRCKDIREHAMHGEYVEFSEENAAAVRRAKAEGRAVIAVGTTSCRALEGISAVQGCEGSGLQAFSGWVNHFLYPGKSFKAIDGMITNFHLPGSSLLMLVSALAGRERILEAYREAIAREFRFFSYGDAMLIL